jgi:hypothetical protein
VQREGRCDDCTKWEVLLIDCGGAAGFHCRRADEWVERTRWVKPSAMRWRGEQAAR